MKFYTEDGNYDLVGNNTPIFFIRDPLKFPDFIHSQKRDPHTHVQEPDNAWDFFSHSPEATHQFTWLFGDRGIPTSIATWTASDRTPSSGSTPRQAFWVKYHFKTDQGIKCLTAEEAAYLPVRTRTRTTSTCTRPSTAVSSRPGRSRCRSCQRPKQRRTASTPLT